ncbi:DUF4224 domain-containing protein [Collimonas sp. NPDC087041]|uniref:DUF4224 domain-containing protein n=1 Tax=Collimonas sp. NPDC087041 TaxID=3363960 RepID=UPI003813D622
MSAIFAMEIGSEILQAEEVSAITGCARRADQLEWLKINGWTIHRNKAGEPIIGRMYARLKLAGINPATLASGTTWVPDFSGVR